MVTAYLGVSNAQVFQLEQLCGVLELDAVLRSFQELGQEQVIALAIQDALWGKASACSTPVAGAQAQAKSLEVVVTREDPHLTWPGAIGDPGLGALLPSARAPGQPRNPSIFSLYLSV